MIRLLVVILFWNHLAESYPGPEIRVSSPDEINALDSDLTPQIDGDVENTIREVERIIGNNPALPRLTRGEILDLLENITGEIREPKSIMVVMPYTPTNTKTIEEFYTKPPVTQIIQAEPFKMNHQKTDPKTTTTTTTMQSTTKLAQTPKPSRRPIRRRITTTTKYPNHRYPEDLSTTPKYSSHEGLNIIQPPNLKPQTINEDLHQSDSIKQEVVLEKRIPVVYQTPLSTTRKPFIAEPLSTTRKPFITEPLIDTVNLPVNLKLVAENLHLDKIYGEPTTKVPITSTIRSTTIPTVSTTEDLSKMAENISPEMRDILMSFGLIRNPNEKPTAKDDDEPFLGETAETKPESYVGFKPLPTDSASRNEMEALLASFGLGRNSREQKAIKNEPIDKYEVVPPEYRDIISDLGIEKRESRRIGETNKNDDPTPEELSKLNQLTNLVKNLEKLNGTTDYNKINTTNIEELLISFNTTPGTLSTLEHDSGPDPTKFDESLEKNEVKRQESNGTTEKPDPNLLKKLEESFGGTTETSTEPTTEATTTLRTGFYYLVDWNTFLDIDDQKGKHVNLRFQPTIGDPKRFLSVNVP